ncbi:MAG: hypothetical protein R3232_02840 [Clostridia bacterium]|nr:hypothetical protein [Clostridia bacterium]
MDIGNRIEMFVDDKLIDSMNGCSLVLNKPVRREKVMTFNKPWESETSGYITVLNDNGVIKMYYRGATDRIGNKNYEYTCYAASDDGIHFFRPRLGLWEHDGDKLNNIILKHVPECHNFAPFIDTKPGIPADEKYKAVGGHERIDNTHAKLYGLVSADGITWNRISRDPIITEGMFDSHNIPMYDPNIKKYRCYARYFDQEGLDDPKPYHGIRSIKNFISEDFMNWENPVNNTYDVPYKEEFYTNATVCCPGAEHFYLSFPKRFMADRQRDFFTSAPAVSDAVFMSSRNGTDWNRTFMEAWVRPGLDRKNWVNRNNMPACGIIDTGGNEFSMYISENYRTGTNGVRRLAIRKFGFASVNAGYEAGTFTTLPITFTGSSLLINYSTSAAGHVKVSVLASDGTTIAESRKIYGDEIFEKVDFSQSLEKYSNMGIRLRFELMDADIYAMRFGD